MTSHLRRRSIDMPESTVIDMGSYSPQFYIEHEEELRPLQPAPILTRSPDPSLGGWREKGARNRATPSRSSRVKLKVWLLPLLVMSSVGGWIIGSSRRSELPKHLRLSSDEEFLADQSLSFVFISFHPLPSTFLLPFYYFVRKS